jgi:hypothetical protein
MRYDTKPYTTTTTPERSVIATQVTGATVRCNGIRAKFESFVALWAAWQVDCLHHVCVVVGMQTTRHTKLEYDTTVVGMLGVVGVTGGA